MRQEREMEPGKIISDVFTAILKANKKENRDAIPHSDTFAKNMTAEFGIDETTLRDIIILLRDAHKIFVFEIAKEDRDRNAKKIEGYVDADITTVRRLKLLFQDFLVTLYEEECGRKTMAHQAITELFPRIHTIANSPLGYVANKAIMLDEYERLLEKNFNEYTEDAKEILLKNLIEERESLFKDELKKAEDAKVREEEKKAGGAPKGLRKRRAVDSTRAEDYDTQKRDMPVEKLISIYGIDFFLRLHLRRYEFDKVKETVEKGILRRPQELKKLKEYLGKIKNNFSSDPGLADHMTELYSLDRVVSFYLHRVIR